MPTRVPKYRRQRRKSGRDDAFVEIEGKLRDEALSRELYLGLEEARAC